MMQPTKILSSIKQKEQPILLPQDYQPSPHTVLVGRGRVPKQNMGNKRLRVLAQSFLKKYQDGDKKCKTQIVSDIISMIRDACKGGKGAFVKHDKDGQWYDLGDNVAREKVGYVFRDLLADKYKSSSKSKVARRHRPKTHFPSPTSGLERGESGSSESSSEASTCQQHDAATIRSDDDDSVNTTQSSSSHFATIQDSFQSKYIMDISDALLESSAFLDDNQQQETVDDILRRPLGSWSLSKADDFEEFDFEYLMKLPLL